MIILLALAKSTFVLLFTRLSKTLINVFTISYYSWAMPTSIFYFLLGLFFYFNEVSFV